MWPGKGATCRSVLPWALEGEVFCFLPCIYLANVYLLLAWHGAEKQAISAGIAGILGALAPRLCDAVTWPYFYSSSPLGHTLFPGHDAFAAAQIRQAHDMGVPTAT